MLPPFRPQNVQWARSPPPAAARGLEEQDGLDLAAREVARDLVYEVVVVDGDRRVDRQLLADRVPPLQLPGVALREDAADAVAGIDVAVQPVLHQLREAGERRTRKDVVHRRDLAGDLAPHRRLAVGAPDQGGDGGVLLLDQPSHGERRGVLGEHCREAHDVLGGELVLADQPLHEAVEPGPLLAQHPAPHLHRRSALGKVALEVGVRVVRQLRKGLRAENPVTQAGGGRLDTVDHVVGLDAEVAGELVVQVEDLDTDPLSEPAPRHRTELGQRDGGELQRRERHVDQGDFQHLISPSQAITLQHEKGSATGLATCYHANTPVKLPERIAGTGHRVKEPGRGVERLGPGTHPCASLFSMPSRSLTLRARPRLPLAGLLLCLCGLASAGWESVSFGHAHPSDGLLTLHHHLFLGVHEHPDDAPGPDDHHDDPHPGDRDSHGDHEHETPKRSTRTISFAASALFRPAAVQGLALPPADPGVFQVLFSLPLPTRPLARPAGPRPPPSLIVVPDSLI
jgi:hypothetical protein